MGTDKTNTNVKRMRSGKGDRDRIRGSVNHVAIAVSNLDEAMKFFKPFLARLGYEEPQSLEYQGKRVVGHLHRTNGTGINVWQALHEHQVKMYEPGLHHLAFNAASKEECDELYLLVRDTLKAKILTPPGYLPYDDLYEAEKNSYYAFYFLGPDEIKFEVVYMSFLF